MKNHFLPKRLTSSGVIALASIVVVLQMRKTFHLQFVPVIGSVWPPGTTWKIFFSLVTCDIALRQRREHAGQRIDHADFHRFLSQRFDDEGGSDRLAGTEHKAGFDQRT